MKKSILTVLFFMMHFFCFSQTIDSVKVTIDSPASNVHIKGIMPQMDLSDITLTSLNDMNNTQVLNLYFKGCPLTQILLPYDTVISINATFPFALRINTFHDTSANCPYPTAPVLTDTFHLHSFQILGMAELVDKAANVSLYPNPAGSLVEVTAPFEVETVSMYSEEGKKMTHKTVGKNSFSIDLTDFPQGAYFLLLETTSNGLITKKIVKKE